MTNFLNLSLRMLTIALSVILLFSGCKKDALTADQLGKMAEAKFTELKTLTSDIPCSQQNDVSVQEISNGCATSYYTVKSADVSRFNQLKKEYFDLLSKHADALVKEGVIIDPCFESIWINEQPIRMECNAGKVQLITSGNISLEEASPLAAKTYEEIMTIVNAQTCNNESGWMPAALIKDKITQVEYIPYLRTQDYSVLQKKVSLYNRLKLRIIQAQGTYDSVPVTARVEKIDCINGKPVIKLAK